MPWGTSSSDFYHLPLSTRVSFRTAVHADASQTSRSVDEVDLLPFMVKYLERRYTPPTGFLNGTEPCPTTRHCCSLVTAAFTTRHAALTRALDRDDLCLRVKFLHGHFPMKTWLTPTTSAKIWFLEGMEDLVGSDKVLEFCLGLTPENLLKTAPACLAHPVQESRRGKEQERIVKEGYSAGNCDWSHYLLQLRTGVHVTLQGIGAAVVHLIGLHGNDRRSARRNIMGAAGWC